MKQNWNDLGIKDKIQYIMAIALINSGILAAFICIIFNSFNIATGVLIYIAQAFIIAGGIFGVSLYFKTKLGEFDNRQKIELGGMLDGVVDKVINQLDSHYKYVDDKINKKFDKSRT